MGPRPLALRPQPAQRVREHRPDPREPGAHIVTIERTRTDDRPRRSRAPHGAVHSLPMDRLNAQGSGAPNQLRLVRPATTQDARTNPTPRQASSQTTAGPNASAFAPRVIDGVDTVELSNAVIARVRPTANAAPPTPSTPASARAANVSRLVAGRVSTPVNFSPASPAAPASSTASAAASRPPAAPTPTGVYSLFRTPAERNSAATGVEVGRSLDVTA